MRNPFLIGALALALAACGESKVTVKPETCDNTTDDDADGKVDCADPDCFAFAGCCVDRCDEGATLCSNAGVLTCTRGPEGCRVLSAPVACTGGTVCSGGSCVLTCSDRCSAGAKQCIAIGATAECQQLATGCYDWVVAETCGTNICAAGACTSPATCTSACAVGASRCTATGGLQNCVSLGNGCTDWAFPTSCSAGFVCSGGSCVMGATGGGGGTTGGGGGATGGGGGTTGGGGGTTGGGGGVTGGGGGSTTGGGGGSTTGGGGGSTTGGGGGSTGGGGGVTGGGGGPTCTDECPAVANRDCSGTGFRTCGNLDLDSCLEWSTVTPCMAGEVCMGGTCTIPCTDECTLAGATRCMGSMVQTCGNSDGDACLEWSSSAACASGGTCMADLCQAPNAPEVRLLTPQGTVQSTQGRMHTLLADATPVAGRTLVRVEFFANGVKQGETTTSPHSLSYTVPVATTTGASISIQAQAVDSMGTRGFSQLATLSVLNDLPVAAFTATIINTNVAQVDASAVTDTETATTALEVCWDWDNNGTCETAYSTTKLDSHTFATSGMHTIGMKVRDAAGQVSTTTRQVNFADIQYLGGANVTTTTWYGTIIVTGDLTVPAGNTLTIASGTQVLFVRQDQDMNMIGDHTLTVAGALVVNGTATAPVLFSGQDTPGKQPGSWDRVVLSGAGSTITWAVIEYADVGLDVRTNATVNNTIVRRSRGDCIALSNADGSTFTDVTTTLCGGDGVDVSGGSTGVTFTRHGSTTNGQSGFNVSGASVVTLDNALLDGNTLHGAFVHASTFNLANSVVASNAGTGLSFVSSAAGNVTRNQVRANAREGLRFEDDGAGTPNPVVNLNNVHSNATVGSSSSQELNPGISASTGTNTSGTTSTSSTYTAPAGTTLRRARISYTEFDNTGNYVTGTVLAGAATVQTFNTSTTGTWVYLPAGTVTLRVAARDSGYSSSADTISATLVEVVGANGAADVVALTASGAVNLQNNYLGTWPNVLSRVVMSRTSALDLQGFMGLLFDGTWARGPYKSGTVSSETWSGTIYVTGNLTIPAGQTVSVMPGTVVRFPKHDQDGDGDGDFTLQANGKLDVTGSMAVPVAFSALAPATGNAFQRVVLAGAAADASSWADVAVTNGRTAIELRGNSTLSRVTVTGGSGDAVVLNTATNATLTDLVVTQAGARGVVLVNADNVTLTRPDVRNSTGFGLDIGGGSSGVTVARAFLGTNGGGLSVSAGSTPTVEDSTIRDNLGPGVLVTDASPTLRYNLITYNTKSGLELRGSGTTSGSFNVVKFNTEAGFAVWSTGVGSPTPVLQSSNVYANGVLGTTRPISATPAISASSGTNTSGTTYTSAIYTAPVGSVVRRVRITYTEFDNTGNYVTGGLQTGQGGALATFNTSTTNQWVYVPVGTASVRLTVRDSGYSSSADTISITELEYEQLEPTPTEAMVATDTGVTDARFNYWTATIAAVPSKIYETRVGATNYSGYTGAEYPSGTVTQVGPRP